MSLAIPKPEKPSPRPRKRIARGKKPARVRKTPRAKLIKQADKLWSKIVKRGGVCDFSAVGLFPDAHPHTCKNGLQAMHGIPRTYHVTRWLPINGFAGCGGIHTFYTNHPEQWSHFLHTAWGHEVAQELWQNALSYVKQDMEATVARLAAELGPDGEAK